MSMEEYENFKNNIESTAKVIFSSLKYQGGMYYPVNEILKYDSDLDMKQFIINELKNLGIEFFNDCTMYRVT